MTHDDKIVLFGMSCAGKTYFANNYLEDHTYYCFDAMFNWHGIETMGLSISANMKALVRQCKSERYVLDGWHLCDKQGEYIPEDATVYVIYADYARIVDQYRIEVNHPEEYRSMFHKWYSGVTYHTFPRVRYWENTGNFLERPYEAFQAFLFRNSR
jgi:adenylate kinase family enzyme